MHHFSSGSFVSFLLHLFSSFLFRQRIGAISKAPNLHAFYSINNAASSAASWKSKVVFNWKLRISAKTSQIPRRPSLCGEFPQKAIFRMDGTSPTGKMKCYNPTSTYRSSGTITNETCRFGILQCVQDFLKCRLQLLYYLQPRNTNQFHHSPRLPDHDTETSRLRRSASHSTSSCSYLLFLVMYAQAAENSTAFCDN